MAADSQRTCARPAGARERPSLLLFRLAILQHKVHKVHKVHKGLNKRPAKRFLKAVLIFFCNLYNQPCLVYGILFHVDKFEPVFSFLFHVHEEGYGES